MTRSVVALDVDATLSDALKVINSRRIACLPVLDADHRVVGVLDERQVLRAFVAAAADTVGELLSGRVVCLPESTPIEYVAAAILDNDVPGAAIVAGVELVGVVTRGDALRGLLRTLSRERRTRFDASDAGGWRVRVEAGVVTVEGDTQLIPARPAG